LVGENISTDQIKKPMRVVFENEPAIDEGGVKKEYFILLFKELFNPEFGMFMYNP
jgi:E3 ubiquitin-protein ligase HERC4